MRNLKSKFARYGLDWFEQKHQLMAVTEQDSTQYGANDSSPATILNSGEDVGYIEFMRFDFVQATAVGDAGSLANLVKLPAGRVTLIGPLSSIYFSAFGSAGTMDVGWTAYEEPDGDTAAASEDGLASAVDVSSAGSAVLSEGLGNTTGGMKTFNSKQGVTIQAKIETAELAIGDELHGFVAFVRNRT